MIVASTLLVLKSSHMCIFYSYFVRCILLILTQYTPWPSWLFLGHPGYSLAITAIPWPSRLYLGHHGYSLAIPAIPWPSRLFLGHHGYSLAITAIPWPSRLFLSLPCVTTFFFLRVLSSPTPRGTCMGKNSMSLIFRGFIKSRRPPDLAGYISKIAGYFSPNNNHNMPIFFISFENVIVKVPTSNNSLKSQNIIYLALTGVDRDLPMKPGNAVITVHASHAFLAPIPRRFYISTGCRRGIVDPECILSPNTKAALYSQTYRRCSVDLE